MRHLLDKHILIVTALDAILGSLGNIGVIPFFNKAPLVAADSEGRHVMY